MTMFPWFQLIVGGMFARLKLERYLAFGKTLATVERIVARRFDEIQQSPVVQSMSEKRLNDDIISGLKDAGLSVAETANHLNVQV